MKKVVEVLVVALSVFVISCQKDQDLYPPVENLNEKSAQIVVNEISVDNAMADINFESDFFIGAESMMMGMHSGMNGGMHDSMNGELFGGSIHDWNQGDGFHYMMGQYPQYSMRGNQGQYPDSLVMNYGMGTQLSNGRVFSGEMIIHNTEESNGNSFMREITYNNFSVDSMMVSGKTIMEITGDNNSGKMHNITEDIWLTMPDGTSVHRLSEVTRQWIEGEFTPLVQTDDMMQVTGYVVSTVNENGIESVYKKEIIEPLVKSSFCRYFTSGIIEITMNGNLTASLDYGNGECDYVAILSKVGGESAEIVLSEYDHCSSYQGNGKSQGSTGTSNQNHGTGMGMGTGSNNNNSGGNDMNGSHQGGRG